MQLENFLAVIPDHRRPQGRRYDLGHLLLFTLLAILAGATSYRTIQRFIEKRREVLNTLCGLRWKRAPAYHSIRYALHGLDAAEVAAVYRGQAGVLASTSPDRVGIAIDSHVLRKHLERFQDRKAAQVLSAFITNGLLVLGQVRINGAGQIHRLEAVHQLIEELGLTNRLLPLQQNLPLADS